MTEEREAVRLKRVLRLVLAALYLGVGVSIIPAFRRRRIFRQAKNAEQRASLRERELRSIEAISAALAHADDAESVARVVLDEIAALFAVEFAGLALVDEGLDEAHGLLARREGEDFDYWRGLRFDLRREPSGIASAVFDAAPVTVYDTGTSPLINKLVAQTVGAHSAAFVPLVSGERVIAVLAIATTHERRDFSTEELGPLRTLAAEAALDDPRTRAGALLHQAGRRGRATHDRGGSDGRWSHAAGR